MEIMDISRVESTVTFQTFSVAGACPCQQIVPGTLLQMGSGGTTIVHCPKNKNHLISVRERVNCEPNEKQWVDTAIAK